MKTRIVSLQAVTRIRLTFSKNRKIKQAIFAFVFSTSLYFLTFYKDHLLHLHNLKIKHHFKVILLDSVFALLENTSKK